MASIIKACKNCGCLDFYATTEKFFTGRLNEENSVLELSPEEETITSIYCAKCGMKFEEENFKDVIGW